jgi:hypothetical protein
MARGVTVRVKLHRETLDAVSLGIADGLFEMAKAIVDAAAPGMADSPLDPYPTGEGLPRQGGALAYVKGGKVAGWSQRGNQPKKPKAVRGDSRRATILVVGGYGFPARLNEFGSVHNPAHPALTPALAEHADQAADFVPRAVKLRLAVIA